MTDQQEQGKQDEEDDLFGAKPLRSAFLFAFQAFF
jgi:hypothetical protein